MNNKKTKELRHSFYNIHNTYVNWLSKRGKDVDTAPRLFSSARCNLYILVVAYNQVHLIENQIMLIKRHIKDPDYQYFVIDNSSDSNKRKTIEALCKHHHVGYIPVPALHKYVSKSIFARNFGSISHGIALNWVFYHFLRQRKPRHFAILDHDMFPVKDYFILHKLGNQDFFGVKRLREGGWYLWPGFCVYKYDAVCDKKINFLPVFSKNSYMDTGGSNFKQIFSRYDIHHILFPDHETIRIVKTTGLNSQFDIINNDCIEVVDHSWIHLINGANWANINGKEDMCRHILSHIHEYARFCK